MSKPRGYLVEDSLIKVHKHFDSAPYANMRMVDVARVLDGETGRPTLNKIVVAKLLDRILTGLAHTILAMQGRAESSRIIGLLTRSMNRLLDRIPELNEAVLTPMDGVCRLLEEQGVLSSHERQDGV